MAMFPKYNPASAAATPDFIRAQMAKDRKKQEKNALRSQQLRYVANLYNKGMGDKTPIADFFLGGSEPNTPNAGTAAQNQASMEGLGMDQNQVMAQMLGGGQAPQVAGDDYKDQEFAAWLLREYKNRGL